MNHNNYGNVGIALLPNRLVIVDAASTFVCRLDDSGKVLGLESAIANPGTFTQRSAYTVDGKVFVAATTGKLYRIDGLPPFPPILSIRASQVELCWDSDPLKAYQVQYRSALTGDQWVNLGETVLGDGTRQCVNDDVPADSPKRFYQVITTP
jgi:hypothetical protein